MNEIFNLEKLYLAYLDCRKGKRKTINALKFEWDLERNLFLLLDELKTKKYRPGRSICFVVKEPTPREIFAANFRDRIIHHLLVREIEDVGGRTLFRRASLYSIPENKKASLSAIIPLSFPPTFI